MKKIIAVFLLFSSMHICSMSYIRHFFKKEEAASQVLIPKVAVIHFPSNINFSATMLRIQEVTKNPEILGALLIIDNRGGAVPIFSALHDLIKKMSSLKPVVGLVIGSALSCGYLLASATDYIIAHSISEIGGIGIIYRVERYKDAKITGELEAGLEVEIFNAGEHKAIEDPFCTGISEQHKEYIKKGVNSAYAHFLQLIATNRGLDVAACASWAEGNRFFAPEALEIGLIDEIGTIFEAEEKLKSLICTRNPHQEFIDDIIPIVFGEEIY